MAIRLLESVRRTRRPGASGPAVREACLVGLRGGGPAANAPAGVYRGGRDYRVAAAESPDPARRYLHLHLESA